MLHCVLRIIIYVRDIVINYIQNWDLKSVRQNINVNCYNLFKNQPMNFITDGKYDGSSRTYHTTFRKATDLSVLAYLSTLNSGKT